MNSFVISLKSANDRRSHILKEFESKDLSFSFFDAIEPNDLANYSILLNGKSKKELTDNEISCLISHVLLWKKVVQENFDYIAIFEDDIYLSNDSNHFLSNSSWIDKSMDIIKIEKINKYVLSRSKIYDLNYDDYKIFTLSDTHLGAGGYILSKNGALCLLDYFENLNELDHVDQIIFNHYLNARKLKIFQMNPVLCMQDCILNPYNQKFKSTLQWREIVNSKKSTFLEKFLREIQRLISQVKNYFFKIKLHFKN